MALSMIYQLSAPSLEGCSSCGQNIFGWWCKKFEKTSPRDGVSITSPQYFGTLSTFASYANPHANHAPSSARTFSSVIDGKGDNNGLAESAAIAAPNAGVASGPAGF